jgi:hypothetical protein
MHSAPARKPSSHSIYCPEDNFTLPLSLQGIISCFHSHTPTRKEIDSCPWISLMDHNIWNPHDEDFINREHIATELAYGDTLHEPRVVFSLEQCTCNMNVVYKNDLGQLSGTFYDQCFVIQHVMATSTNN